MNGTAVKNLAYFDLYYIIQQSHICFNILQIDPNASKIGSTFENMLGENLMITKKFILKFSIQTVSIAK